MMNIEKGRREVEFVESGNVGGLVQKGGHRSMQVIEERALGGTLYSTEAYLGRARMW